MTLETKDKHTQNLINGLNLLLSYYPQAKVRKGSSEDELHVRGVNNDLPGEIQRLLNDWYWELYFYEDIYYWEFNLL